MSPARTPWKTRIGFYCLGTGVGGPWRYVRSLLAGLDPDEFEVVLYCHLPDRFEPALHARVVQLAPPAAPTPWGRPAGSPAAPGRGRGWRRAIGRLVPAAVPLWAGFGRDAVRLSRLIRRHPVDLFHTQYAGCEEAPVAARLAGTRVVVGTFHVGPSVDLHRLRSGPAYRVLETVSNRCLDVGIAVSQAVKREWVNRTHLGVDRVRQLYNGIDPDAFCRRVPRAVARRQLGYPDDTGPVIGSAGRLDEGKGFRDLLAAAARLGGAFPGLKVYLAGDGPDRVTLEASTQRLGIGDRVRFLGFRSDVQPVLDALDVFIHPTLSDALPYAVMEAMAAELPIVATTVGGVPEIVAYGETGLLVPPRDPDALASALRTLLKDAELRARMGAAGRERVIRQFNERDMVRKTVAVYRTLLNIRAPRVAAARGGGRAVLEGGH